jgi:uncharacterized delta-60 repeat protein
MRILRTCGRFRLSSFLGLIGAAALVPACSSDGSGGGGGGAAFVPPAPFAVALSTGGPDRLMAATAGPGGSFYAAGYSAAGPSDPKQVVVVKILPTGSLDATFGTGGVAVTGLVFTPGAGDGADEIDVAVQSTGKIVVSATVAAGGSAPAGDTDVAVARLNADGTVDSSFGTAGVLSLSLNEALDDGGPVGKDGSRALAIDPTDDRIYLHAFQRNEGATRTDTDFAVVRVTADGAPDTSFGGGDGKFVLDIGEANATPRALAVLSDRSVLASGYANTGGGAQPVLYRLTSSGDLVESFAVGGVYHHAVLAVQTEIYGFAVHGTALVTAGYGRETGSRNDWVSLRFHTGSGDRDLDWGGSSIGAVLINPSPNPAVGSNCRSAVGLPGGKTILLGSTGTSPTRKAVFAVLAADGTLDPAYGAAPHLVPFGANTDDQFWGGALSGTQALLVGWRVSSGSEDAYALLLPVQ